MAYQWTKTVQQYDLYTPGILEEIVSVANTIINATCPTKCSSYHATNHTSDCHSDYSGHNYGFGGTSGCNGDNTAKYSSKCVNSYYSSVNNKYSVPPQTG